MIIVFRSKYTVDPIIQWAYWIIGCIAIAFLTYFVIGALFSASAPFYEPTLGSKEVKNWRKLLTGPLALHENTKSALALSLEQKLLLFGQSLRPDRSDKERVFCIGIKGSSQQRVLKEGQEMYLNIQKHLSGGIEKVEFIEKGQIGETSIAMIPHFLDEHSISLRATSSAPEILEVILQADTNLSFGIQEKESKALQEAKWWGHDLFFREYGGLEYKGLSQKEKIEIVQDKKSYCIYVALHDFLSLQAGKWKVVSSIEEVDPKAPLAQVRALGPNYMEIEGWDQDGLALFQIKLLPEQSTPLRIAIEKIVSGAKLRSFKKVSCQLDKKKLLIQAGDWLIRSKNSWYKLKTLSEVEAYLNHEVQGDLLVIDSIDNKGMIKGHYFDPMRIQVQLVSIPFSVEKKGAVSKGVARKK